jgi:hypothetical protein
MKKVKAVAGRGVDARLRDVVRWLEICKREENSVELGACEVPFVECQ